MQPKIQNCHFATKVISVFQIILHIFQGILQCTWDTFKWYILNQSLLQVSINVAYTIVSVYKKKLLGVKSRRYNRGPIKSTIRMLKVAWDDLWELSFLWWRRIFLNDGQNRWNPSGTNLWHTHIHTTLNMYWAQ